MPINNKAQAEHLSPEPSFSELYLKLLMVLFKKSALLLGWGLGNSDQLSQFNWTLYSQ